MLRCDSGHGGTLLKDDQTSVCLISEIALGSVKDDSEQPWRATDTDPPPQKTQLQTESKVI